jgi:hypothetical protein
VSGIYFADPENGYLFGPGLTLTHDGGHSWSRADLPAVIQVTGGDGFVFALSESSVGGPAGLWRNAAGSTNWVGLSLPTTGSGVGSPQSAALQLEVHGAEVLLLKPGFFGPLGTSNDSVPGALWVSDNDGSTWRNVPVPCVSSDGGAATLSIALGHPKAWLLDCFSNLQSSQEQHTQNHLYGTATAGDAWVRLDDPAHTGVPGMLADNGSGHAILTTVGISDRLYGTFDGALHWSVLLDSGGSFNGWTGLQFVSSSVGFVVAPTRFIQAHLYRTSDGGQSWHALRLDDPA